MPLTKPTLSVGTAGAAACGAVGLPAVGTRSRPYRARQAGAKEFWVLIVMITRVCTPTTNKLTSARKTCVRHQWYGSRNPGQQTATLNRAGSGALGPPG